MTAPLRLINTPALRALSAKPSMRLMSSIHAKSAFRPTSAAKPAAAGLGRQIALFQTGRAQCEQEKSAAVHTNPAYSPPEQVQGDKVNGSYHWDFERGVSIALIPLCAASAAYGAHPVTDLLLGVALPLHSHIGFDACITDYVHWRKFPVLNKLCTWSLRVGTGVVLYGCYQFNTNDVGLTEGLKRFWKA